MYVVIEVKFVMVMFSYRVPKRMKQQEVEEAKKLPWLQVKVSSDTAGVMIKLLDASSNIALIIEYYVIFLKPIKTLLTCYSL